MALTLHKDVDPSSICGGQAASGELFGTEYWCVYCGAKFSTPRINDIYVMAYGYDQTNLEWFQVVKRSPKSVVLRAIKSTIVDGREMPLPGEWALKRVNQRFNEETGYIDFDEVMDDQRSMLRKDSRKLKVNRHYYASPWNGESQYSTRAAGLPGH